MPFPCVAAIILILLTIGIISLADALLRVKLRTKKDKDTLVVLAVCKPEDTEQALRYATKKYPAAKIMVKNFSKEDTGCEILKKDYPNVIF